MALGCDVRLIRNHLILDSRENNAGPIEWTNLPYDRRATAFSTMPAQMASVPIAAAVAHVTVRQGHGHQPTLASIAQTPSRPMRTDPDAAITIDLFISPWVVRMSNRS
jgi:hypothetical protein